MAKHYTNRQGQLQVLMICLVDLTTVEPVNNDNTLDG